MKSLLTLCAIVLIYDKFAEAKQAKQQKAGVISKNSTHAVPAASTAAAPITTTRKPFLPGFKLPCSCLEGQCGCCTGVILDRFKQKACLNITYEPDEFAITAQMSMNGRILYTRTVSGKNPEPMCVRVPRLQFIRLCVQFSNIYFASRNVHLCIDMEANWEDLTLVEWSFDCIRMGASGVAVVGIEDGGGIPANPVDSVDQTDEDYDDSARNAPLINTNNCRALIFDKSLARPKPHDVDKTLFQVKRLPKGDIVIAYGPAKP